jgi:hypothetical protein
MGSGKRIELHRIHGFALGFSITDVPFAVTIHLEFGFVRLQLGFGKPYDQI